MSPPPASTPIVMDVTPLGQPVDAIEFLLAEIGQMQFDPRDPAQVQAEQMAIATWQRLNALRGKVVIRTADRMVIYALGRAVDDPAYAGELHRALSQVVKAHGGRASRGRTVAELAEQAAAAGNDAAPEPAPKGSAAKADAAGKAS